jgi:hypothetical protein
MASRKKAGKAKSKGGGRKAVAKGRAKSSGS